MIEEPRTFSTRTFALDEVENFSERVELIVHRSEEKI